MAINISVFAVQKAFIGINKYFLIINVRKLQILVHTQLQSSF